MISITYDTTESIQMLPDKPALLIQDVTHGLVLIIADLHLGYLYGRSKRGILIPRSKLPEEELIELVEEIRPRQLIVLGDFKDEIFGIKNPLVSRIFNFYEKIRKITNLVIVKGNHDGKLEEMFQSRISLIPSTGLCLKTTDGKTIGLWHGHSNPALDVINADTTITGHVHPAFSFRDELGVTTTEKVWIKARWHQTETDSERLHIIMPAFNRYISGRSIDDDSFNALIAMKEGIDFQNAEVFTLQGVLLGSMGDLQEERRKRKKSKKKRK
ncbi:MAG: hypothetical protein FK733_06770 [Asgard group archaeon]|nr:hypothetical protein [Asgard group archaeon]